MYKETKSEVFEYKCGSMKFCIKGGCGVIFLEMPAEHANIIFFPSTLNDPYGQITSYQTILIVKSFGVLDIITHLKVTIHQSTLQTNIKRIEMPRISLCVIMTKIKYCIEATVKDRIVQCISCSINKYFCISTCRPITLSYTLDLRPSKKQTLLSCR